MVLISYEFFNPQNGFKSDFSKSSLGEKPIIEEGHDKLGKYVLVTYKHQK